MTAPTPPKPDWVAKDTAGHTAADWTVTPAAQNNIAAWITYLNAQDSGKQAQNANLTAISALVDPNADRILFWDDSAGTWLFLTLGTNLSITGTTLNATGGAGGGDASTNTATSVVNEAVQFADTSGKVLKRSTFTGVTKQTAGVESVDAGLTQISALVDPNADRILFWDDSAGAWTHLTLGTNLSITGTTLNAAGGAGATNLTSTLTATTVTVNSDTGTDVAIAAADTTNAGVMTAADRTKLTGIATNADVTAAGNVGTTIHGATAKTTPVDADELALIDSAASNALKRVTFANLKAAIPGGGSGDVVGPASATDNAVARYDTTTGKLLQTSLASVDDSGNVSALNAFLGFATTVTAAGITTLTVTSPRTQEFTGTTTQTVRLPTTGVPQGASWRGINNSTGNVTWQSSGANTVLVMGPGTSVEFIAEVATPTTAANWTAAVALPAPGTSGNVVTSNGTIWTSAAPPTGTLPSQTGHSGQYLTTNGTAASWASVASAGSRDSNVVDFGASEGATAAANFAAFQAAVDSAKPVYVPPGAYNFTGAGLVSASNWGVYDIYGDGPGAVNITLGAASRFIDHADPLDHFNVHDLRFTGGLGFYRSTYTGTETTNFKRVYNMKHEAFTGTWLGHRAADSPYWRIRDVDITAADDVATMGFALSGLVDYSEIMANIIGCRVGIKLGYGGGSAVVRASFFKNAASTVNPIIDIWVPPINPSPPDKIGLYIGPGTRFGNESLQNTDFRILFADAAAGTFDVAFPVMTASTGTIMGVTIDGVAMHCADTAGTPPLIRSTTPNILGLNIKDVQQWGVSSGVIPLLTFSNATGFTPTKSVVGPVFNNNIAMNAAQTLVTTLAGTLYAQPPKHSIA